MKYFLLYLLLINAAAFLLMLVDKFKARRNLWRIPERVLMLVALFGGSAGALLGMYAVRHKTRHKTFTIGIPAILIAQLFAGSWIYLHFFS